ncbi:MAG: VWA domain-containing protein [Dysgonamonadaceae bacterium]|jgi:uncharacterized protein YegL|nr:VWA domain-containing protein [Dysgonamonadaceae bacterium]
MRRLPIYFLIDISESMVGEPIEQVQDGMATIVKELRTDSYALETVYVSIIAFAGRAKKISPLTELYNFYPPKLPIGGGTSLGAVLGFLMYDLDVSIRKTTLEEKGDWKPIIFLFTDGNPTDEYEKSFERWNQKYRRSAGLIVVSIGDNANMNIFGKITENILVLKNTDTESFKNFFKWVTASIKTSSVSVSETGNEELQLVPIKDDSLQKIDLEKHMPAKIDDNFVVILAKCQTIEQQYLIKYQKQGLSYRLIGAFPLDKSYSELSDGRQAVGKVNTSSLSGFPTCPCCGNQFGFSTCMCGGIHCSNEDRIQTCPWCGGQAEYGLGGGNLDVARTRG